MHSAGSGPAPQRRWTRRRRPRCRRRPRAARARPGAPARGRRGRTREGAPPTWSQCARGQLRQKARRSRALGPWSRRTRRVSLERRATFDLGRTSCRASSSAWTHRRLGAALEPELGQQRGHVVLDGLLREEHPCADLAVRQALSDQVEDALSWSVRTSSGSLADRCSRTRSSMRAVDRASSSEPPAATVRTAPTGSALRISFST
jgi:hypothetical protein